MGLLSTSNNTSEVLINPACPHPDMTSQPDSVIYPIDWSSTIGSILKASPFLMKIWSGTIRLSDTLRTGPVTYIAGATFVTFFTSINSIPAVSAAFLKSAENAKLPGQIGSGPVASVVFSDVPIIFRPFGQC